MARTVRATSTAIARSPSSLTSHPSRTGSSISRGAVDPDARANALRHPQSCVGKCDDKTPDKLGAAGGQLQYFLENVNLGREPKFAIKDKAAVSSNIAGQFLRSAPPGHRA